MLIKRNRSNVHRHEGRSFFPGINFLPDDVAEKFFAQESFKAQFTGQEQPMHVVSEDKASSFKAAISKLKNNEALSVVKETWHPDLLNEIIEGDSRQSVVVAAQKQIEELKREPTPEEQMNKRAPSVPVQATFQSLGNVH